MAKVPYVDSLTFLQPRLADRLLQPLFGKGRPDHVDHLTAFRAESFGGPDRYSRESGGTWPLRPARKRHSHPRPDGRQQAR
jgi:truncated hemoglobin YjbI